jgi:hypothetical protein
VRRGRRADRRRRRSRGRGLLLRALAVNSPHAFIKPVLGRRDSYGTLSPEHCVLLRLLLHLRSELLH